MTPLSSSVPPASDWLVMVTEIEQQPIVIVLLNSFGTRTPLGDAGRVRRWLETGSGPRDRPGANQGAVPVVQWEYFAQAALLGEPPPATDWLDGCPVRHSGSVVMVVADDATGFAMAERVAVGDWLFVDTARHNDGLVVVIMAGWQRAELRELTSAGGSQYLQTSNPRLPSDVLSVQVHTRREAYAQALQTPRQERLPALVLGRVVFRGGPE